LLQGDGNRAVGGDGGSGRVAVMAGGDAQVFRRAAEADIEFAVVGVNDRQAFTEIGGDGDAVCAEGEAPRLGVVAGGGADGVFDEGRECGVFHGVLRVAGKVWRAVRCFSIKRVGVHAISLYVQHYMKLAMF